MPITTGNDINNPDHALLEFVKKIASPTEKRKFMENDFFKKFWDLSRTNAIQKGQIKFSQDPA